MVKSAVETTIESFKQAWQVFELEEKEKQSLIHTIEKHNPKLLSHVQGLIELANLARSFAITADEIAAQQKTIATEQDIATAKMKEADEEFKAKFIKVTTLAYGFKALFNDVATMTEALGAITPPTLYQVAKNLSLEDRLKIYKAMDEVLEEELK